MTKLALVCGHCYIQEGYARKRDNIITHVNGNPGASFPGCLSVYSHDISKSDAARMTKFVIEMFHSEARYDTIR